MSDASKDVVMGMWRAFSSRDPEQIEACFTEDAVWIAPERNATAIAIGDPDVTRLDRARIAQFIAHEYGRLFVADVRSDITALFGEGDTVATQLRSRATLANGRPYDLDYCFIFKVRDGRVCQMREYMDTLGGYRQIYGEAGVAPAPALI